MKRSKIIKISEESIIVNYYWIVIIGYVVAILLPWVSVVALSSLLLLTVVVVSVRNSDWSYVTIYCLYLVLSGVLYIVNQLPVYLFATGIAYSLLPVAMYFAPKTSIDRFYRRTFAALLFSFMLALLLYYWAPEQYRLYAVAHGYYSVIASVRSSYQGLYGVTLLGSFSACAAVYFLGRWLYNSYWLDLIWSVFSVLIVVLSGRRSAIVACFILLFVENIVFWRKYPQNHRKQIVILACGIVGGLLFFIVKNNEFMKLFDRITHVGAAISERQGNWKDNLAAIQSFMLGKGLGAGGHQASAAGYLAVHDSSYIMILVETGLIGLCLFSLGAIHAIITFARKKDKSFNNYIALFIVLILLIQAIGSNVFEFPNLAVLFWFSLSAVQKDEKALSYKEGI